MKKWPVIFFTLGFLGILLFYLWSHLLWISLVLLVSLDFFTLKWFRSKVAKRIPQKFKQGICYFYYLVLIIGSAIFIRTFIIDIYYVPTSSMERTLFPGDYVLVNKFTHGVKVPQNLNEVPVIGAFFKEENSELKHNINRVLSGFKKFKREAIVVFKSVTENDKLLIKRIIGLPGETISIKDGVVYINQQQLKELSGYTFTYRDSTKSNIKKRLKYANAEFDTLSNKHKFVRISAKKNMYGSKVFPHTFNSGWSRDNYGPLFIPKKGMTIKLTKENKEIYGSILINFEKVALHRNNVNKTYTFKQDYYFMMGDNRQNSQDSRFFGFVPSYYIQGQMLLKF